MLRSLASPGRLLAAGAVLLAVTAAALWLVPSDDYLLLPSAPKAVDPLVTIERERDDDDGGGIYYVAAIVRRAKVFESIFPSVHDGVTLVPEERINQGQSEGERRQADLRAMARSQDIAAAVALRELGRKVRVTKLGALVTAIVHGSPADEKLLVGDVIVAVDGKKTPEFEDIGTRIRRHRPGERVTLRVRTNEGTRTVVLTTARDPDRPGRAIIGVLVTQATQIHLPLRVDIDAGSIGGPSAGLAFALEVMEELGRDVDRGYRVAATGELDIDGAVTAVGAMKQKTVGVRRSNVDVFLVPGDNAGEARRYAGNLRVIPVRTFRQALQALATLPPRA